MNEQTNKLIINYNFLNKLQLQLESARGLRPLDPQSCGQLYLVQKPDFLDKNLTFGDKKPDFLGHKSDFFGTKNLTFWTKI